MVTVAAGGSSDIGMRTIAAKVEQIGGPKIVVENRPGGGGVTATLGVKDAPPDGRTLLLASYATFVVNPAMPGGAQYDPIADFQQITTLFSFPVMLAVPSSVEAKTVPELIALAKRKPGGLSYASQGVGTAGHLLGELFAKSSGVPLLHVPYKGAAPAMIDLVAGRVDMMFVGVLPSKAAPRRRHAARAGGHVQDADAGGAGRADHGRGRPSRRQHGLRLVRARGAGQDAGAGDQEPARAVRQGRRRRRTCATSSPAQGISVGAQHAGGACGADQGRHREVRAADQGLGRREIDRHRAAASAAAAATASARPSAVFGRTGSGSASCRPTVVTAPSITVCATSATGPSEMTSPVRGVRPMPLGEIIRQRRPRRRRDRP